MGQLRTLNETNKPHPPTPVQCAADEFKTIVSIGAFEYVKACERVAILSGALSIRVVPRRALDRVMERINIAVP